MSRQQSGFTLIELIIVIVILGALAVVALPRFIDLEEEANQAAVEGVAGNISSAFSINYADSLASDDTSNVIAVKADDEIDIDGDGELTVGGTSGLLTSGDLGDYTLDSSCEVDTNADAGFSDTCTLTRTDSSVEADFTYIATE